MNQYPRIFLSALAVFAVGGSAMAFQENSLRRGNDGPPPPGPMRRGFPGPERFFERLNLSTEQQTQIRSLHENTRSSVRPYFERLAAIERELNEATANGNFDEGAVRAIASRKAEIEVELTVIHTRTQTAVYNILTQEQRNRLSELRKRRRPLPPNGPPPEGEAEPL